MIFVVIIVLLHIGRKSEYDDDVMITMIMIMMVEQKKFEQWDFANYWKLLLHFS